MVIMMAVMAVMAVMAGMGRENLIIFRRMGK